MNYRIRNIIITLESEDSSMHLFQIIPSLLAQAEVAAGPEAAKVVVELVDQVATKAPVPTDYVFLGFLAAAFVVPIAIAYWLAHTFRVPESRSKIVFILLTIGLGLFTVCFGTMKLGIDLKGGVILIYQVDLEQSKGPDGELDVNLDALCGQLARRINPSGTQDIVVRPYGEDHVEIIIPDVDAVEIQWIKDIITKMGQLDFLIVANFRDHETMIEAAKDLAENPEMRNQRTSTEVKVGDKKAGRWVNAGRDTDSKNRISVGGGESIMPFKIDLGLNQTLRNGLTGALLDIPEAQFNNPQDDKDHKLEL
ncbi:MAG: SecD/SecF fusion protein, partial [Pirellulaceae bacterium]